MYWIIYDSEGNEINRIAADEDFTKALCEENGWIYKAYNPVSHDIEIIAVVSDTSKINVISDRIDFLEDCVAEMAMQVYN